MYVHMSMSFNILLIGVGNVVLDSWYKIMRFNYGSYTYVLEMQQYIDISPYRDTLRWLRTIVVWLPIKPIKDAAVSQLLATN